MTVPLVRHWIPREKKHKEEAFRLPPFQKVADTIMTHQELYRAAIAADDAFSATLNAQGFTSRWYSYRLIMANKATRTAYFVKLDANEALAYSYRTA